MDIRSIVSREGCFEPGVSGEVQAALRILVVEMMKDDGGEDASYDCLSGVVNAVLREQGVEPIPDGLTSSVVLAGRLIMDGDRQAPWQQ